MYTMMTIFIFVAILFVYLHMQAQWKTSDDLEIYEADYQSAKQLQEIVSVKQPVLFKVDDHESRRFTEKMRVSRMEKYDNIDVHIKEVADYYVKQEDPAVDYVSIPLRSALPLLGSDSGAKYFSENNGVFLEESGLLSWMQSMDDYWKPALSAYSKYDILFGSAHAATPLRFHLTSQTYLLITQGKIRVKMCPPKYRKVLPVVQDYENYEFRTSINVWETLPILDKIKFLEFDVAAGTALYIPQYWWYAIKFSGESTVATFQYDQVMNLFAQANHWGLYLMQQSNIRPKLAVSRVPEDEEDSDEEDDVHTPVRKEIVTNANVYETVGEGME